MKVFRIKLLDDVAIVIFYLVFVVPLDAELLGNLSPIKT
jgi:hypothetical protein